MENYIKKLLEELANDYEKELSKITTLYEWTKEYLHKETGKTDPALSIAAYHAVKAKLATTEGVGKEINVIFYGKDDSKDTNKKLRLEILKEFWDNPESRKKIIEEGKIMVRKVGKGDPKTNFHDVYKPVVSIEKSTEVDGEFIVLEGELWDPATNIDPICRDFREYRDDEGNVENWLHTHPLDENWQTPLFGIGYFEDTKNIVKRVQIRFYGNSGNPSSADFVVKQIKFMESYKLKVQLNEKQSTYNCYIGNAKSKPVFAGIPGQEVDIIPLQLGINEKWKQQLKIQNKPEEDLIPIVEFSKLKEWHMKKRAKKDDKGEISKTKSGWDELNYDEFCLIDQVTFLGMREFTEDYRPAALQHDSTGTITHFANYDQELSFDIPIPCDLLICVKTSRGTTKYDRETREKIKDDPDPDLTVYIRGFKVLMGYEKIVFPKELVGDL